MNLDKLKSYRVDSAYTTGVTITLPKAPDVAFQVVLPGKHNRAYIADVYGALQLTMDGDISSVQTSVLEARERQEQAFLRHCLKSIDGEPVPDSFADEYPEALEELMAKANEMALALQEDADDAEKKSVPTSAGSIVGAVG
jgi:hypothetical protein